MEGLDENGAVYEPFKDFLKQRFIWYYESYLAAVDKASKEVKDGQAFTRMPFEGGGNTMDGKFNYTELEKRLRNIKKILDDEPVQWAAQGKLPEQEEETVTVNLRRQLAQVREYYKQHDIPHNIELEDDNPFVWIFTYFGRPMTNMDGGLFRVKIHLSPRFPEEQPRIKLETKLFHVRVAPDGTPCCWPATSKKENMQAHLDAIVEMLEEESPAYDPRTLVHPEAFRLFWGNDQEKKQYRQRLRRSVQASVE